MTLQIELYEAPSVSYAPRQYGEQVAVLECMLDCQTAIPMAHATLRVIAILIKSVSLLNGIAYIQLLGLPAGGNR